MNHSQTLELDAGAQARLALPGHPLRGPRSTEAELAVLRRTGSDDDAARAGPQRVVDEGRRQQAGARQSQRKHAGRRRRAEPGTVLAADDGEPAVIYDMPLLVEKGQHEDMDLVVVVHVDVEKRIERLVNGRGLDEADVRRRIAAQATDEERLAVADVVIDNNGLREKLEPQVQALVDQISL